MQRIIPTMLKDSRISKESARLGPALRDTMELHTSVASLALWVKRFYDDDSDPEIVAYTDGVSVASGPKFDDYNDVDQRFIVIHELLHIALCHPYRAYEYMQRLQENEKYVPIVGNIAMDAIINDAIERGMGLKIPEKAVKLRDVLYKNADQRNITQDMLDASYWSFESLYEWLMESVEKKMQQLSMSAQGGAGKMGDMQVDMDVIPSPPNGQGDEEESEEDKGKTEQQKGDDLKRKWENNLRIMQGTEPGMMQRLLGDLPKVRTPWENIMRTLLKRYLNGRKTRYDAYRPSRRFQTMEPYFHSMGIMRPFSPKKKPQPSGRVTIIIDSSGSITDSLFTQFAAEIVSIMEQTGCIAQVIVCDAAVTENVELKPREIRNVLDKVKFSGGGGTDFRPAIAAAEEWRPDVIVYMTDLYGTFPQIAPKAPIIWAVTPMHAEHIPYGTMIPLEL